MRMGSSSPKNNTLSALLIAVSIGAYVGGVVVSKAIEHQGAEFGVPLLGVVATTGIAVLVIVGLAIKYAPGTVNGGRCP